MAPQNFDVSSFYNRQSGFRDDIFNRKGRGVSYHTKLGLKKVGLAPGPSGRARRSYCFLVVGPTATGPLTPLLRFSLDMFSSVTVFHARNETRTMMMEDAKKTK